MKPSREYPDDLLPWNLEPQYARHVAAMTAEGLHSKAEIAMQLAWRDQTIEALRRIVKRTLACGQLEKLEDARRYLGDGFEAPAASMFSVRVDRPGGNVSVCGETVSPDLLVERIGTAKVTGL